MIDSKGELLFDVLEKILEFFEKNPGFLGPSKNFDPYFFEHIERSLRSLKKREVFEAFHRISPPLCHQRAEEIVRETALVKKGKKLEICDVRRAALACFLTLLRQASGSCFASAYAILLQREYPLQFFIDLHDLLLLGQLRRVHAGQLVSVPLNIKEPDFDWHKKVFSPEKSYGVLYALKEAKIPLEKPIEYEGELCAGEFFEKALYQSLGLTQEMIADEEALSKIQMSPLFIKQTGVYYRPPTERGKKVREFREKLEIAKKTFYSLTECFLLRSWEYSLASFADVKTEFAKWNLFIGLGLHPEEKGGIGEFLHRLFTEKLEEYNREIDSIEKELNQNALALDAIDAMFQTASDAMRRAQLKSEFLSLEISMGSMREKKNALIEKTNRISRALEFFIDRYIESFPKYFQEIFDPKIQKEHLTLYEDSMAGFRLIYKHGREDASLWTAIEKKESYLESLQDFFSSVEKELFFDETIEEDLIKEVTSALIRFLQTEDFFQSALRRAKERGRRSPWDYFSGGTLQTLVQNYTGRDAPFREKSIRAKSADELYRFLKSFQSVEEKGLLMHSPTHAFLFYPHMMTPLEKPLGRASSWKSSEKEHLVHSLCERIPPQNEAGFLHRIRQSGWEGSSAEFRLSLIDALQELRGKESIVDALLFEKTPLFPSDRAKEIVKNALFSLRISYEGEISPFEYFGPYDLYREIQRAILFSTKKAFSEKNWDPLIRSLLFEQSALSPQTLFADTNWSGWFFGFVFHPISEELELWRLSKNGMCGFPMSDWKKWLRSDNEEEWTVLYKSEEYAFLPKSHR